MGAEAGERRAEGKGQREERMKRVMSTLLFFVVAILAWGLVCSAIDRTPRW